MAGQWVLTLKNLCLPIFCVHCERRLLTEENGFFCPTCWEGSARIHRPFCSICGRPHPGRLGFDVPSDFTCADCKDGDSRPYTQIYGAAVYDGAVAEAIKLLKFRDKQTLAGPLGAMMGEFACEEMDREGYTDIVPVPLHRVRERQRGYNQATLLAEAVLDYFPGARLNETLRRIRPTRVQSKLADRKARLSNVVGAFAVDRSESLDGRTVLLIDDVVSTGGTVSECASALNRAGAARVDVLAAGLPVIETDREGPKRGLQRNNSKIWK